MSTSKYIYRRRAAPKSRASTSTSFISPSEIQRKCDDCEKEEKDKKVQRKAANSQSVSPTTASFIPAASGNSLPKPTQQFFAARMGHDFSDVNIHTGSEAENKADEINAKAYTLGNHIIFNKGQYDPESFEGKKLLAHELTHVIQQKGQAENIHRKILIDGVVIKVDVAYLKTVKSSFGKSAVTIVEKMHNNGNSPDFAFDSWDKFSTELRIRSNAIKGMDEVHAGCCNYQSSEPDGYLDPLYWNRNGYMDFTMNATLPSGKQPSDAVESIFKAGANTQLECLTMTIAIEYYSLLKGMGKDQFNKKFAGGAGLIISTKSTQRGGDVVDNEYTRLSAGPSELIPGDWVYFKNFKDYTTKHPGGFWQGENAIVMGDGKYRGFGVKTQSETELNNELVKVYNDGLPTSEQKSLADLLKEGGGLQKSPVYRPNVKKLTQ